MLDALALFPGMRTWINGGWGVDALLGYQARPQSDLDEGVYVFPGGLAVDIHCVRFDARGYGNVDLPDGGVWPCRARSSVRRLRSPTRPDPASQREENCLDGGRSAQQ